MKKILIIILAILLLTGCSNSNEPKVKYDEEQDQYQIELEGNIKVAVVNEDYGEALLNIINKDERLKNRVEYVVYEDFNYEEFINSKVDIALLRAHDAVLAKPYIYNLTDDLMSKLMPHLPSNMLIDDVEHFFLPISAYGTVFATDIKNLEDLGYDIIDSNNDNLVDSFDTIEEIIALNQNYTLNLDDPMFAYTYGNYDIDLFNDINMMFEGPDFLRNLNVIKELGDSISYSDSWNYENIYNDENVLFSEVGSWMYHQSEDIIYSKQPSYKGLEFSPLVYPKGYVLSKECQNVNLAYEVLRVIYSNDSLQAYIDNTQEIVVYNHLNENNKYKLNYKSISDEMFSKAFMYSELEDFKAFEEDSRYRVFDSLEPIGYYDTLKAVFKHEMTPEDAQLKLIENFKKFKEVTFNLEEQAKE